MPLAQYAIKKIFGGIQLLIGVTFLSFLLMVYFGPDLTYEILGKNPSPEAIQNLHQQLGYDQPFFSRYAYYLKELVTLDFGYSYIKDKKVATLLSQALPVSMLLMLPGFIIGNGLALALAMTANHYQERLPDQLIMTFAVIGMSISFIVIIIAFQVIFSTPQGLDAFPVRGWQTHTPDGQFDWALYLNHVTVPTLATVFVTLGYNTRFYRAVLVETSHKPHFTTAKAYGHKDWMINSLLVLKNAGIAIITRIMYTIPLVVISGSLLIESYFGIPGIGQITYDAILAGDQPILKAVVGLTAVTFIIVLSVTDLLYVYLDPRVKLT